MDICALVLNNSLAETVIKVSDHHQKVLLLKKMNHTYFILHLFL